MTVRKERSRSEPAPDFPALVERTTARYRRVGRFTQGYVRGKLRHDPVYRALLEQDLIRPEGTLLDLGCGRGIALALLASALDPHVRPSLFGVELRAKDAQAARTALGESAQILTGDIRTTDLPIARVVLLIDVLLYLPEIAQEAVLDHIVRSLAPGGLLLMREADRSAGWRFQLTRWAERSCALGRGDWAATYHYRSRTAWQEGLEQRGLQVTARAMSEGTPFSNVLFIAQRPEHDRRSSPPSIPTVTVNTVTTAMATGASSHWSHTRPERATV